MNSLNSFDDARIEILKAVDLLASTSSLHNSKALDLLASIDHGQRNEAAAMHDISASMHQLARMLADLKAQGTIMKNNQRMLRSLLFKMMKVRESKIASAHKSTFEWIFDEQAKKSEPAAFVDWLKKDGGVFWVMGKVGSGKSTLMKFLASHRRTKQALLGWAGANRCISASYFFWNAGTRLQKSQEGLLQTLLFEVLRQCPAAIPVVLDRSTTDDLEEEASSWTMSQLLECFSKLRMHTQHSTKFCFFIDGLDEYEGECSDLITALQDLSASPMIKICASSRPWFVFKDAFGQDPENMLKLEDLTRRDIEAYANDMLSSHPRFPALRTRDTRYLELIKEITDRARGVFLWVFLVTTSLRRGLTNADSISDLQKRMSLLPDSLEDFFRHILGTVEDVYRTQTAKMFQYALNPPSSGPIPLIVFSYLDEEDPDFALRLTPGDPSMEEIEIRYDEARRRLDGRTRGLLEASAPTTYTEIPTVDFLHRTVRDYFLTRDMQNMLQASLEPEFIAEIDLCKAHLAQMKWGPWYTAEDCLNSVMFYVHDIEWKYERPLPEIVEEIKKTVCAPTSVWEIKDFEEFLVDHNLYHNVAPRLEKVPRKGDRPLLDVALRRRRQHRQQYLHPEIIALLLKKGADPNETFGDGLSVWARFLCDIYATRNRSNRDPGTLRQVVELLLSHGAEPGELISLDCTGKSTESEGVRTAAQIIKEVLPNDADTLLRDASHPNEASDEVVSEISGKAVSEKVGWVGWVQERLGFGA